MKELLENLTGNSVSLQTIWRTLCRSGYRMKKVYFLLVTYCTLFISFFEQLTRHAIERSALKRARFTALVGLHYTSEQLVFVDESSADQRTTYRGYAWAIGGQRAVRSAFFVRGRR